MKSLRCRLGRHSWSVRDTEDGEPYVVCTRCEREGPGFWDVSSVEGAPEGFRWGQGGPRPPGAMRLRSGTPVVVPAT
ncbi:hypothetical protein [Kineococcus indalonis]|uniref:hypothetical protein n=1 Tax=Kineococcus indalonis TaxID=2696566 RepID=UPI001412627A|nr:hypothetical protein [Kineococcus indalonis]NAZ87435.1 hypothetical protein [Kineococcus indalonis]